MYDATTARFMQEDTYGGNANDPLSLNLYTYSTTNISNSGSIGSIIAGSGSSTGIVNTGPIGSITVHNGQGSSLNLNGEQVIGNQSPQVDSNGMHYVAPTYYGLLSGALDFGGDVLGGISSAAKAVTAAAGTIVEVTGASAIAMYIVIGGAIVLLTPETVGENPEDEAAACRAAEEADKIPNISIRMVLPVLWIR
jgi:hypothetical protein